MAVGPKLDEHTPLLGQQQVAKDEADGAPLASGGLQVCGKLWYLCFGDMRVLAYTVLTTMATSPTLLFGALHMSAFLGLHHINVAQVAGAQLGYILWSCVRGLLAGYSADWFASWYGSHLSLVAVAQVAWCFAAFLPFLPLPEDIDDGLKGGIFYFGTIAIFESLSSVVAVGRTALVAEFTRTEGERLHVKRLNTVFGGYEALVMLLGYGLWNTSHPGHFQIFFVTILLVALISNSWSSSALRSHVQKGQQPISQQEDASGVSAPPLSSLVAAMPRIGWIFVAISALHELQGTTQGQFMLLMLDSLLADEAKFWRVSFVGAIGVISGTTTFLMTWIVQQAGLHTVLSWTFRLKVLCAVALGGLGYLFGPTACIVCLTLMVNDIFLAMFAYFQLLLQVEIIEDLDLDRTQAGAAHPLADCPRAFGPASLMGIMAFCTTPFGSLGTVLGTGLLSDRGGGGHSEAPSDTQRWHAFALLAGLPLVLGCLQLLLWDAFYSRSRRSRQEAVSEVAETTAASSDA